jgi:muramoyltetrapeptide carboxypeptidase
MGSMDVSRRRFVERLGTAAALVACPSVPQRIGATALSASPIPVKPHRLTEGDTVALVSPSGITYSPVNVEIMEEILAALGLKSVRAPHLTDRWGYLAGSDQDRASDINAMFADESVDAIFALHGGWGAARLLPLIDFDAIRAAPKVFLGFSDITSLLIALYARTGLVTYHGPNGNSSWNAFTVDYLKRLLFKAEPVRYSNPTDPGEHLTQIEDRVRTISPGTARGRLVGGNLTVLTAIIGSDYLPDWTGHILFLEDTNEEVYRVDRMLMQLKLAGVLDRISGFIFGKCTRCEPDSSYSS